VLIQEQQPIAVLSFTELFDIIFELLGKMGILGVLQIQVIKRSMLDVDLLQHSLVVADLVQ
jgi:hypothetical protein